MIGRCGSSPREGDSQRRPRKSFGVNHNHMILRSCGKYMREGTGVRSIESQACRRGCQMSWSFEVRARGFVPSPAIRAHRMHAS